MSSSVVSTGIARITRSASEMIARSSEATSIACRIIARSSTAFRSTPITSETGHAFRAASAIEPPTRSSPTTAIRSNTGGAAGARSWTIGRSRDIIAPILASPPVRRRCSAQSRAR